MTGFSNYACNPTYLIDSVDAHINSYRDSMVSIFTGVSIAEEGDTDEV
jgi:hypothetical protein